MKCHAGCKTEDVVAALGLTMADLAPPKPRGSSRREAEYIYKNTDGAPVLKKVKLRDSNGSKSFFWQRYDGKLLINNRNGVGPMLYGLESLKGETMAFIVEGEKDADSLHKFGWPAVSLPDGAGSAWHDEYGKALAGLSVYIIPDNDGPGLQYAKTVAENLVGIAKAVYQLDLTAVWPEMPEKADITDFVEAVGMEQAVKAVSDLAQQAKPYGADNGESQETQDSFLACFKPLDSFEEEEAEWLVPLLIPKGQITTIASDGGVGKTTVWCNLVAAISAGKECFLDPPGFHREPQLVVFLTTEDSVRKKLKKRLREAGALMSNIITPDFARDKEGLLRKLKFGSPQMEDFVRYYKPALCVFDPLQGFVPPEINMGSRNAMRDCMAPLISLGEETGTTFLVVCHTNKRKGAFGRDRIADSADLWDISRSVLMLGFTEDQGIRYLSQEKSNYAELQETKLFSIDGAGQIHGEGTTWKRDREYMLDGVANVSAPNRADCKEWILTRLDAAGGTMPTKDLEDDAKADGYSYKTLRRAKDELKRDSEIRYYQVGAGKEKAWYVERLKLPNEWVT